MDRLQSRKVVCVVIKNCKFNIENEIHIIFGLCLNATYGD